MSDATDLKNLFQTFKRKYHTAVVKDEALGNDESGSLVKEKKAREAWAEANQAEQIFLEALEYRPRLRSASDEIARLRKSRQS